MARYAWGTAVTVEKSRAELMTLLARHGIKKFATAHDDGGDALEFLHGDQRFRFSVPMPTDRELARDGDYDGVASRYGWPEAVAREHRRRWRAHLMLLKMKLEFVSGGDTTMDREFMAHAVLPNGQTVGEAVAGGKLLLGSGR